MVINKQFSHNKKVVVGICAMKKKSYSKPMQEILKRLQEFEYISIVIFDEDVILKSRVEDWPLCDCLLSFHSAGFPLDKAQRYVDLRQPYVINDLGIQHHIQSRTAVYSILEKAGIDVPKYAVMDRSDAKNNTLFEGPDHVEVNGVLFKKPFVEKPISAEDHNVHIYYATSDGGGSHKLFRKVNNCSSEYCTESKVRKAGSFVYEEFLPTNGRDIKVYTVGPHYAYAEARKSPALDGKVERNDAGKEVRYPVVLTPEERLIAKTVCLAFKQTVCGFDLLRANGKSYVCDVNGFSFVKSNPKYYNDCARILARMVSRTLSQSSQAICQNPLHGRDVQSKPLRKRLSHSSFTTKLNDGNQHTMPTGVQLFIFLSSLF